MSDPSSESVSAALRRGVRLLAESGCDSPRLDAELLLSHVLGLERTRLLAESDRALPGDSAQRYNALLARRAAREPVAYLVGHRAFYDVDLVVDARVLIPRPETEHLVECALEWARRQPSDNLRVVDVGTGSGAVAIVLARRLPQAQVLAVDVSPAALDVARENVRRYDLQDRVTLRCADLLGGVDGPLDLIAANLPYVCSAELPTLAPEVRDHEPRLALDGGPDGLALIGRLVSQVPRLLARPGLLALEIDPRQASRARELTHAALPAASLTTLKDYAGWERVLRAELAGG